MKIDADSFVRLTKFLLFPLTSRIASNFFSNVLPGNVKNCNVPFKFEGDFSDNIVVGTNTGLLHCDSNSVTRVLPGYVYGITKDTENSILVQQDMLYASRTLSINLDDIMQTADSRQQTEYLEWIKLNTNSVHQIDYYDGCLYICDTDKNRLLAVDSVTKKVKSIYPDARIYSRNSKYYRHFNSVYISADYIYLLAHNESTKSGIASQVYVLDKNNHKLSRIINTNAKNAHNIVFVDDEMVWCNTMSSTVESAKGVLFKTEGYITRGLSITNDYIFVGGSEIAKRGDRSKTDGMIYVLDKSWKQIASITLYGVGGVLEIRAIGHDYGLSQSSITSNVC